MTTTVIGANNLTLLDQVRRREPNGNIARIVESLSKMSPFLEDAVSKESNGPLGHLVTQRTGLPSVGWRRLNEGVAASKSKTAQFTESCGMLDGWSNVDCANAEINGDKAAFRMSEDMAFLAAMKNEVESGMFYHSTNTAPEKFNGLSTRFTSTTSTVPGSSQIISDDSAHSGSDQTSIYLVGWGDQTVFTIFPKGTVGGLVPHDMGIQVVTDSNGLRYRAYQTNWEWKIGLVVQDYRYVVRIANIDTSGIVGTGSLLIDAMIKAYHKMYDFNGIKPVWYCNRTVATYLHLQAKTSVLNSTISLETVGGKPVTTFLGIPVHVTDALLNTEAEIS